MFQQTIAVVTRETRLEGLQARWATAQAAMFRMEQAVKHEKARRHEQQKAKSASLLSAAAGSKFLLAEDDMMVDALADVAQFADEDRQYQQSLQHLLRDLELGVPVTTIDRTFLPNFDFSRCVMVVVLGQDGLVANVAKYAGDLPIVGVNPDPTRYDGVLLPFQVREARGAVRKVLDRAARVRPVTLAEATTNDSQRLLAFNDFFIGCASHASARYTLEAGSRVEPQSSSGVLISTGAGSTGWLSSFYNMLEGFTQSLGGHAVARPHLTWEDRRLAWVVREPFRSKHSGADLVAGMIESGQELVIGSQMPVDGVIFSDGVQSDFLEFNAGSIVRVKVADQQAHLVVK